VSRGTWVFAVEPEGVGLCDKRGRESAFKYSSLNH
jgi:hypothetical protein